VLQHVWDHVVEGPEEIEHLLHLAVEQRLVDLGEVASLHGVEGRGLLDVGPELAQRLLVLKDGLGYRPHLRGEDLARDVGILHALALLLALFAVLGLGRRGRACPACDSPQEAGPVGAASLARAFASIVVQCAALLGGYDVAQQALEDIFVAQVLDELRILLLELLDQVRLVEQLLDGDVGLVEDVVERRQLRVTAKAPEHGGLLCLRLRERGRDSVDEEGVGGSAGRMRGIWRDQWFMDDVAASTGGSRGVSSAQRGAGGRMVELGQHENEWDRQASTHLARRSAGKAMASKGREEKPIHAPSVVRSLELEVVRACRVQL
jgi:hypothetical protein